MTIVLDTTNIIQTGFDLNGISITLLRELARERSHRLVLPDVVLHELRAKKLEQVKNDFRSFQSSLSRVRKSHPIDRIELPDPEHIVNAWVSLLEATFEVEPLSGDEARAALFREAAGHPPSERKVGARDSSIWEVVKRLHLHEGGETYFVSHNSKDFGNPADPNTLHPVLLQELEEAGSRFHFLQQIDDVLDALGKKLDAELTVLDLDESHPATAAVMGWVQLHPGRKAFSAWSTREQPPTSIIVDPAIEALPVAVESSTAYEVEGRRVVVAKTRWQLGYIVVAIPGWDDTSSISLSGDVGITLLVRDLVDGSTAAEVIEGEDLTLTLLHHYS